MKRGTAEHPKIDRLAKALGIESWGAAGILELLWHYCCKFAVRGDIGRWTNQEIADGIKWGGNPDVLIDALVTTGWIDKIDDPKVRLVVHDVSDHADNYWKQCLQNQNLSFWNKKPARSGKGGRPRKKQLVNSESEEVYEIEEKPPNNLNETSTIPLPSLFSSVSSVKSSLVSQNDATDLLWRRLRLSCGEFHISQDQLSNWKVVYPKINVELVIEKFERKYAVQDIKLDAVKKTLATWLSTEDPLREKKAEHEYGNIKDASGFNPSYEPTESDKPLHNLLTEYRRLAKRKKTAELEHWRKTEPDTWKRVQDALAREVSSSGEESLESDFDF